MPPKKPRGKGKVRKSARKTKELSIAPVPEAVFSDDAIASKEIDVLTDINDEFFDAANKIIQSLMENERPYEASKVKKYVNIIFDMHRKYAESVKVTTELMPKVERADQKLRVALEVAANSEEIMDQIRLTLSTAWKESDASQAREQDVQEKLQELVLRCENLESKEDKKQDDSAEFGHLSKYKNIILRERDRLHGEVADLEKRIQFQRYYCESLEYINKNNEDAMTKMSVRVRMLEVEKSNVESKSRSLFSTLEEVKDNASRLQVKLDVANFELHEMTLKYQKKSFDYDQQKHQLEKTRSENVYNTRQIVKLEEEISDLRKDQKDNEETIRVLRLEDKAKFNTITLLNKKVKKTTQDHNAISSKLYKLNRLNNILGEDIVRYKNNINALEKDLLNSSFRFEDLRHIKDKIQHDRDNLRSDIAKQNNVMSDLRHTIVMQTNNIDGLHLDINRLNVRLDEAKINISKAEKERDEMAQETETLHERIEYLNDTIQNKTNQVTDLSEKLTQKHHALINIKKQLETVHSEKMVLKRNLETCTQERDNFRVLQTKTSHQTLQFTNEISANQNRITFLNMRIEHLNTDKKELQSELRNKENLLAATRKDLKELKKKNESLLKTISDDEAKFMKISMELDEVRKEKNLIGLQMVRRNDEIMLLKDKLIIMQTALDHGQTQYNQRVEDVRLLKMEVINLQTERECLSRALKSTADMRQEIIRLQRLLNQERIKVRSLTEDAKTPTGVHRWRILKGEDPSKFQLLGKVQMLQRQNLKQEIHKAKLEQKLEESQQVCESLKRVVENLPTTDVKQKLVVTQRINRQQMKKLKALSAELAIDEIELKARECIIEEFKDTLKKTKIQQQQQTLQQKLICQDSQQKHGMNITSTTANTSDNMTFTYSSQDNYVDCIFLDSNSSMTPKTAETV